MKKFLIGLFVGLSFLATSVYALSTFQVFQGGTGATSLTGCLTGNGTGAITGTGVSCGSSGFGEAWKLVTNIFSQSSLTPTTTQNIVVNGTGTSTFAGGVESWRQISAPYFQATSTTATSSFSGHILENGADASTYLHKIVPSTVFGSTNANEGEGTVVVDNTLNTLGMGLYMYTDQAGTPSNPLAILRQTGATNNQGLLWLLGPTTNSTQGGAFGLKVQDGDPDIEFVESDQVAPAGKYEFEVQNDLWRVNGRNTANNSFDSILTLSRLDKGGAAGGGKFCLNCGPSDQNAAQLTIFGTSTQFAPYLSIVSDSATSTTYAPGDIFTVNSAGKVGIGTTSPGSLFSIGNTNGINISATATSSLGFGLNIRSGCFSINNVCIGGGGGSGTVTSIATNNGLTGGTITTTGTLGLNTAGFSTNGLLTWDGSNLVATGTPQLTVGNIVSTSSAISTFAGETQFFGTVRFPNGITNGLLKVDQATNRLQTAVLGTDYITGSGTIGNCSKFGTNNFQADTGFPCGTGTLTTSTPAVNGNIPYFSGVNSFANVATSSLAIGSSLSNSGALGSQIGGTNSSLSINTANPNSWSVLQTFNYSSSTAYSTFQTSSSTIGYFGSLNLPNITGTQCLHSISGLVSGTGSDCGSGGGGTTVVSTSTPETANQIAVWTTTAGTPAKLTSVATSTPTATAPITYSGTLGSFVGGSSGAFDCTSATGSVKGCLLAADWTTFNGKLGAYDAWTHPSFGLSATTSQMLIGTSTASNYQLTISSSTAPQLSLSAGTGIAQWTFRNAGGDFFLSTTTVAGNATTSTSALSIIGSSGNVGIGTSTPNGRLIVQGQGQATGVSFRTTNSLGSPVFTILDNGNISDPSYFTFDDTNNATYMGNGAGCGQPGGNNTFFGNITGGGTACTGTGVDNTAMGYGSFSKFTTGIDNAAFGQGSLNAVTSGRYNVSVGSGSGFKITTGSQNTALGYSALGNTILTQNNNIAVGYSSGYNVTGYANISIGAMDANRVTGGITSGNGNIGIANEIFFPSSTANNQLNIGGIIFGTLPATTTSFTLPLASGAIGIATSTNQNSSRLTIASTNQPQLALEGNDTDNMWTMRSIGNTFYLATSSPITYATSTQYAFGIDINGFPIFPSLLGTGCAQFTTTGKLTNTGTACGSGAGGTTVVSTSTAETAGQLAYWTTTAGTPAKLSSVATSSIGAGTGLSFSGTAGAQVGGTAGTYSVNTSQNIATLSNLTTNGVMYTVGAAGTLKVVATSTVTFTSPLSGTSFDVLGSGGGAITLNTVTVAKGGTNNTVFSPNTIITADSAGTTLISTTSQLTVGNLISTTTVASYFTGSLGIGTTTPYGTLSVNAAAQTNDYFNIGSSTSSVLRVMPATSVGFVAGFGTTSPAARFAIHALYPDTYNNNIFLVASSSVSATSTLFQIAATGAIFAPNTTGSSTSQTGYWCYDANGQFIRDTAVCLVSARKFKKDIQPLDVGLADLMKLKPVSYYYKDANFGATQQMGFIADDVALSSSRLNTMLVGYDSTGAVHGFNYNTVTALITKAVQDLYGQFQKLIARVSGLESKVAKQQKEIDSLEARLSKLEKK